MTESLCGWQRLPPPPHPPPLLCSPGPELQHSFTSSKEFGPLKRVGRATLRGWATEGVARHAGGPRIDRSICRCRALVLETPEEVQPAPHQQVRPGRARPPQGPSLGRPSAQLAPLATLEGPGVVVESPTRMPAPPRPAPH